jgi:hypothetical protein
VEDFYHRSLVSFGAKRVHSKVIDEDGIEQWGNKKTQEWFKMKMPELNKFFQSVENASDDRKGFRILRSDYWVHEDVDPKENDETRWTVQFGKHF